MLLTWYAELLQREDSFCNASRADRIASWCRIQVRWHYVNILGKSPAYFLIGFAECFLAVKSVSLYLVSHLLCPRPLGALSDDACLMSVCLTSVTYIQTAGCMCGRDGAYWLIRPGSSSLAQGCRCAHPLQGAGHIVASSLTACFYILWNAPDR